MDKKPLIVKCLAVGMILLFVGVTIAPAIAQNTEKQSASRGTWLYVGGSGPGNHSNIQEAITAATDGDTIFVYNGTYNEQLTIEKQINLIGEERETTVINGNYAYDTDIIYVTADQVLIQGFTIQHADIYSYCLVFVDCSHHTISDCHFFENKRQAIMLLRSSDNTISHCTLTECKIGIVINNEFSDNNIISDCYIATENQGLGVGSSYNLISNCTLLGGEMTLTDGTNNSILNCHIANQQGSFGIQLGYTTNNTFRNNSLEHCGIVFHCNFPYEFYQDIDTSNVIDGKPVYYLRNESNREINESMNPGFIILVSCRNFTIKNLTCHGIIFGDTSFSTIENCSFFENILGVDISLSTNNIISNCSFSYDSAFSIRKSSQNIVKQCMMPHGSTLSFGISIDYYSYNNTVYDCDIEYYPIGVYISGASQQNKICNCSVSHSDITGFKIWESNNIITKCHIYENEVGITLWNSNNFIVLNNFINNRLQVNVSGTNTWNNDSMGNYWNDYHCFDLNSDGIRDLPYQIEPGNEDQKPLMQPFQKIISKPTAKHLYINDNTGFYIRLTPFGNALILGGISIDVTGNDWIKVEFYIDNDLKNIDTESPFQWLWIEKGLSKHVLRVIAYTEFGNTVIDEINVINIF